MKKSFIIYLAAGMLATGLLSSCKKEIGSLNGPEIEDLTTNPTRFQLNNVVIGTESGIRTALDFYLDAVGVVGREMYRFATSEPRYVQSLMGKDGQALDNNAFYLTNPWNARYRGVKACNILIEGATNSTSITEEQRKAYLGFAKTIKAYQLLLNLNLTYTNGIRVDVADPDNPGPFLNYEASLQAIWDMLNEAKSDFTGSVIEYTLSEGFFYGSSSPAKPTVQQMIQFNRAIAARVALYRKDWPAVLTALNETIFELNGDLKKGYYHVFSTRPGDQTNLAFFVPNASGEVRVAHPSYAADIIPGDDRISKAPLRINAAAADQPALVSNRDVWVYTSNLAPIPIVRNEELILMYAEAKIYTGIPDAVVAINRIRNAHGLPVYAGGIGVEQLITELLYQRRYSLFFEGHRWVDVRRHNRLATLPNTRPGDTIFEKFPIPLTEGQ